MSYTPDGSLFIVGLYGYYWLAVPNNSDYGCAMVFNSGLVFPLGNSDRSYGQAVRPVSE